MPHVRRARWEILVEMLIGRDEDPSAPVRAAQRAGFDRVFGFV